MADIRLGAGDTVNDVDRPVRPETADPVDNVTATPWPHGEKAGVPEGPNVLFRAHGVAGGEPC